MKLTGYTISEFAKLTTDNERKDTNNTLYGTVITVNDKIYVKIDGSDLLTPANTETEVKEGERVSVLIQNHSAVIRGNSDNPSASMGTVEENYSEFTQTTDAIYGQVGSINGDISELSIRADEISTRVESQAGYMSMLSQRADEISSTVEDQAGSISRLIQRADEFEITVDAKADSSNIISTINMSREGIRISSDKISVSGFVTFEDLSGSGTTTINGSNITTGSISGDRIKGGTISATEEISFVGGARIFGNDGYYGAGLTISASQYSFSGATQSFMYGNWNIYGSIEVDEYIRTYSLGVDQMINCTGLNCQNVSADGTIWAGQAYINGAWVTSDVRLKTDIRYVDNDTQTIGESGWMSPNVNITKNDMFEFIETLPIVSYRYKDDIAKEKDITHYGIVVQDVLYTKVGSELVKVLDDEKQIGDEDDLMGYSTEKLMIFICGALQEEIKARKALEEIVKNKLGE